VAAGLSAPVVSWNTSPEAVFKLETKPDSGFVVLVRRPPVYPVSDPG
jgi:hypothetical protein